MTIKHPQDANFGNPLFSLRILPIWMFNIFTPVIQETSQRKPPKMYQVFTLIIISAQLVLIYGQNLSLYSDCDQVFTKKQFIIESPRYPSNYPLNYQCAYILKGPTCPTYFNLQLLDFNLEESLGCVKDRLEIDNQDALCGNINNIKTYFAPSGTLALKLVSDSNVTGRGFRILVTRSVCNTVDPKEEAELTTTTQRILVQGTTNKISKCCQNSYLLKHFILTSPNFPYSLSTPSDCSYEIHKANRNVCRIRIHVQFFWLGNEGTNCSGGFLEMDGRYICGCKSELKLVSTFEGDSPKILRFVSRGNEKQYYSGFVLEVIQDECPKRYIPEETIGNVSFRYYNDQVNRVSFPNITQNNKIEKLKLISENTEIIDNNKDVLEPRAKIIKHIYFFADHYFNDRKDREETTYVDPSHMDTPFVDDSGNYQICLQWNRQQIILLAKQNLPNCKTSEGTIAPKNCVELNYLQGYFKSPGYPVFYPGNLNICYRFKKSTGYCSIKLYIKDFQIENSPGCHKDYLLIGNHQRNCGSALSRAVLTLDLRGKSHEDVDFVTDAFYCDRGFYGTYEQIACQDMSYPINPILPPSTPSYSPRPTVPCHRTIQEAMFTLDVYDYNTPTCSFGIEKSGQDVCRVKLYFEKFDLICTVESLIIDGTMYCGHLEGQHVTISLDDNPVILYKKSDNPNILGHRLRIRGIQIPCPEIDIPAERLQNPKAINSTNFILKLENNFKDFCGIIRNSTEAKLPTTFCDLIKQDRNVRECLPLSENSLFVPLLNQTIELKIGKEDSVQELEIEQINCEDM